MTISIHAPRTGSDVLAQDVEFLDSAISIHAPRTGSDKLSFGTDDINMFISIHAPRTGSDNKLQVAFTNTHIFQSTLPARGATPINADTNSFVKISIHAPRTGSDRRAVGIEFYNNNGFQSTLPARGATASAQASTKASAHFNPRSPHGERQ